MQEIRALAITPVPPPEGGDIVALTLVAAAVAVVAFFALIGQRAY